MNIMLCINLQSIIQCHYSEEVDWFNFMMYTQSIVIVEG